MNEKIKELFEKAHDVEKHTLYFIAATMEPKQASREEELRTFNPETFAELIIKECADYFFIEYGVSELTGYDAAAAIKQHFGIE